MPIGTPTTEIVPSVGAAGPGYATDINETIVELQTAVGGDVPFSALSGSQLDMQNVPIIDATYVSLHELSSVPSASPVGRLARYQNNLYWITDEGVLRMTDGQAIDVSSVGGIGGDYGGGNPALVTFSDSNTRYEFYDDQPGGVWAYLRGRGFDVAAGSTSSNMARIRYGGASSYDFTLPATIPGSNRSVLVISSTGQVAFNDGTNTITNDLVIGTGAKIQHPDRIKKLPLFPDIVQGSTFTWSPGVNSALIAGGAITAYSFLPMHEGEKLSAITVAISKTDASAATLKAFKGAISTGAQTQLGSTQTSTATGNVVLTVTGLTEVIASTHHYYLELVIPTATDALRDMRYTYKQDA